MYDVTILPELFFCWGGGLPRRTKVIISRGITVGDYCESGRD